MTFFKFEKINRTTYPFRFWSLTTCDNDSPKDLTRKKHILPEYLLRRSKFIQAYLLKPYGVLVRQYVQPVLAFGLCFLNSLTCRVRVVATFATTLQHAPSTYSLVPILTKVKVNF